MTIMKIPHGFKIRKKADLKIFINECMTGGSRYAIITDDGIQFVFYKDKNDNVSVVTVIGDNIFVPSIKVARTDNNPYKNTVEHYIWQNRKYINKKWFKEGR